MQLKVMCSSPYCGELNPPGNLYCMLCKARTMKPETEETRRRRSKPLRK